jgi:sugar (pentulose or hexulose) kinase
MCKNVNDAGHVLAIDGGGSSVKVSVVALADGSVASLSRTAYQVSHPAPDRAEFDPGSWWEAIVEGARAAVAVVPDASVRAVVCTGMRIPFVLVDASGCEVGPGILNHDRRGGELLDEVRAAGGSGLYARTGHWAAPEFGIGKLAWLARHEPARLSHARHVLQFHDWLVFRLCGAVVSEPSSAAMSGALDLAGGGWAEDLLAALGVDPGLFPPLVRAGSEVGGVRAEIADVVGIAPGTPVLAGGGDTHMSCLGIGNAEPGDVTVVAGSTTPVMLAAAKPPLDLDEQPIVSPHVFPGAWAAETNAGQTGIRLTWLLGLARELGVAISSYDDLTGLAATSPVGARGLFVVAGNPFWGEAAWASTPPGAIVGLTPSHSVADIARATLEGSAGATAAQVARLERVLDVPVGRVRVTGGASRSAFWCQLLADTSGRVIEVAGADEPSSMAAALVVLGDPRAVAPPELTAFAPDAGAHDALAPVRARYEDRFAALCEVST